MKYFIWYSPKDEAYYSGIESDLQLNAALNGQELEILYELDETERILIKKIVDQLNQARRSGKNFQVIQK